MPSASRASSARRWCCGAASSTRSPTARSPCSTLLPGAALVYALLSKNLVQIVTQRIGRLPAAVRRDRCGRALPRARAPVARSAVLPRGVRRAQDPAVAGQPRAVRDRSRRSRRRWSSSRSTRRCTRKSPACSPAASTDGQLVPVTAVGARRRAPLALDGGLVTMLRWSDEPLEIFLDDPRSPARRLPPAEIAWLERTGASLLVPVLGQDRALVGVLVLGAKRSEEAYSTEDRELLASIAAQVGLGLDVARLRRRAAERDGRPTTARITPRDGAADDGVPALRPLRGCGQRRSARRTAPRCSAGPTPRVIDNKYRDRAAARTRRHGRGLPRARRAARSAGRGEGGAPGAARRPRRAAPLPARGADRRAAAASRASSRSSTSARSTAAAPIW